MAIVKTNPYYYKLNIILQNKIYNYSSYILNNETRFHLNDECIYFMKPRCIKKLNEYCTVDTILRESKIKQMTGGDSISVRPLFEPKFINITPTFKEIETDFMKENTSLYYNIIYQNSMIDILNYEQLVQLKENLYFYINYIDERQNIFYLNTNLFKTELKQINNAINKFANNEFNEPIIMKEDDCVNCYNLYNIYENIANYDKFLNYVKIWNKVNLPISDKLNFLQMPKDLINIIVLYCDMNDNEFINKFDDVSCSDWSKMDRNGNSFGGFWKCDEYQNAYDLSYNDNRNALLELPYPREFILETVEIGCNNRMESVRYTNTLCEWTKRKIKQVGTNIHDPLCQFLKC
jgi:hypothetical protein